MNPARQPEAGAAAPRPKRQRQASVRHGPPTAAAPSPSEARSGQQPAAAACRPGSSCRGLEKLAEALLASPPDSLQAEAPLPEKPALPEPRQRSQTLAATATGVLRVSRAPPVSFLPAFQYAMVYVGVWDLGCTGRACLLSAWLVIAAVRSIT